MFNNDLASCLPASLASRYGKLRRSSVVDHPSSDNTIVPSNVLARYEETVIVGSDPRSLAVGASKRDVSSEHRQRWAHHTIYTTIASHSMIA
jgi:hypothetical protein